MSPLLFCSKFPIKYKELLSISTALFGSSVVDSFSTIIASLYLIKSRLIKTYSPFYKL